MTSYVVARYDTADALGSGDVPVLATPRLIAWLEAATVTALTDLGDDDTSVGTRVNNASAATPQGPFLCRPVAQLCEFPTISARTRSNS